MTDAVRVLAVALAPEEDCAAGGRRADGFLGSPRDALARVPLAAVFRQVAQAAAGVLQGTLAAGLVIVLLRLRGDARVG